MNEQLIVKNFGPIKDATVDFKRVTVFIGPTGGGKSTLAKLAAIFLGGQVKVVDNKVNIDQPLRYYNISNYKELNSSIVWRKSNGNHFMVDKPIEVEFEFENALTSKGVVEDLVNKLTNQFARETGITGLANEEIKKAFINQLVEAHLNGRPNGKSDLYSVNYIPTERVFIPAIEYSWAGLMRDDIGLPKLLLDFANDFSLSRSEVLELDIPFLNVKYFHVGGRDFIKIPNRESLLMLLETASGIQSVTPLLVLLEHLSRNTEQAQSFIIEEPELNLYPTAQRDLVYWLLEKCTQGENDLTITTHSPYVLSALNLALYANKVATLFPHQRKKVAKLIPEKYWLKAEEFSAYFVAKGDAKSIFDTKTGLLSESQLDEVSGEFADVFDRLTDLRAPEKKAPTKAKTAKK
ncbi:AAA family ATPase [Hymenobacter convexus]|uniref:AAA family ATPase n=1 Tax=Hymenobacter sp. CA1UV-4 TaxID=3063782 RepID=UPI002713F09D|nr:AAA family ATPase [Hymenobacter sp. CA1UV-4]MDO7854487.1 AAA family ATPase [Hymenobacter sp. CA1UV-4]